MPNLVTAYNTVDVAAQSSFLLLLWCRIHDSRISQEFLVGQARIKLDNMVQFKQADETSYSFYQTKLCMANKTVG